MAQQTMDLSTRVFQTPGCVSADLGGETAILDPDTGLYFSLNPVGTAVWESVAQPRPLAEVLEHLLQDFEVDRERCTRDLLELAESMRERKLIQIAA